MELCGKLWSPATTVWRKPGAERYPDVVSPVLWSRTQQLPKLKPEAGLRALPARDHTTTIRAHGLPQRADPPLHNDPQTTRASAVPSTPHGTQALTNPSQPDLALMACPPVTAQSSAPRTAAQQHPAQQQQQQRQQQQPHPPPLELPPRSHRDPQRGDLLAFLPGRPVVMDVCVTHPLAASDVAAAARTTGATAEAKDALKRNKYSRTGTGACSFVPLSHETYGRAGPEAFALLNEIAEYAAGIGSGSKKLFTENAMRDLSTTLCRGVARQVIASMPLQARMDGRAVLPGLPVLTDGL